MQNYVMSPALQDLSDIFCKKPVKLRHDKKQNSGTLTAVMRWVS
jgi:hypothetical protein